MKWIITEQGVFNMEAISHIESKQIIVWGNELEVTHAEWEARDVKIITFQNGEQIELSEKSYDLVLEAIKRGAMIEAIEKDTN